jgi:hypothetical protein
MESHVAREQTSQSWVDMRGVITMDTCEREAGDHTAHVTYIAPESNNIARASAVVYPAQTEENKLLVRSMGHIDQ